MMLLVAAIAMSYVDEGTALTLLFYSNHHMLALFVCRVEGVPHLSLIISMFRR